MISAYYSMLLSISRKDLIYFIWFPTIVLSMCTTQAICSLKSLFEYSCSLGNAFVFIWALNMMIL